MANLTIRKGLIVEGLLDRTNRHGKGHSLAGKIAEIRCGIDRDDT
jgi:hypothetical protein